MSTVTAKTRRWCLVFATPDALRQAATVLPRGAVLENEVERLIFERRCRRFRHPEDVLWIDGDGWEAKAVRGRSRLDPTRKTWTVISVSAANTNRRNEK